MINLGRHRAQRKRKRAEATGRGASLSDEDSDLSLFVDDAPKPMAKPRRKKSKKKGRRPSLPGQLKHSGKRARAPADEPVDHSAGTKRIDAVAASAALPPPESRRGPGTIGRRDLKYAAGVLECVKGPEEGLSLSLMEGEYTVGRGRDNTFVLKDIAASREHVKIEVRDNRVFITDLGSGNGTRVNGERCAHAELGEGDRLEIGNSVLQYAHLGRDESALSEGPTAAPSHPEHETDQQRIVMAAERLAAELAGRFNEFDDDDSGPTKSAKPKRRPPPPVTREPSVAPPLAASALSPARLPGPPAVPPNSGPLSTPIDVPRRAVAPPSESLAAAVPQEMWADGETRTRMPDAAAPPVVAPLRSPPPVVSLDPPMAAPAKEPYRPQVQGVVSVDRPAQSGSRLWLVLALVSVLVFGAVVASYFLLIKDRIDIAGMFGAQSSAVPEIEAGPYDDMMVKAQAAAKSEEHALAVAYASAALQQKPEDENATTLRDAERQKLNAQNSAGSGETAEGASPTNGAPPSGANANVAKAPANNAAGDASKQPAASAAGDKKVATAQGAGRAPDTKSASPTAAAKGETKVEPVEPAAAKNAEPTKRPPPPTKAEPKKAEPKKAEPKKAEPKKAEPKKAEPKKAAPRKKAAPKKRRKAPKRVAKRTPRRAKKSSAIDCDTQAASKFKSAINDFRADNYDAACAKLEQLKKRAPKSCIWRKKTESTYRSRCE